MSSPELELKAVVPDPEALRVRLLAAGAVSTFRGVMSDRRFDRDGELERRGEVLRVRSYQFPHGRPDIYLVWKGAGQRSREGYKERPELELPLLAPEAKVQAFLAALRYDEVHAIDRYVEVYRLNGATLRLEWYPRMDVLLEVEGSPEAIERAVPASGIPRDEFTAESLVDFVRRYEARTGTTALLALGSEERPVSWTQS